MSDEQALLEAVDLTRVFGYGAAAVRAVDQVSLEIRDREVVALVGESGSGKSTLARLLLRLLPASSGSITLRGVDVTGFRGRALRGYWRDVQAVFQDPFSSFNQFFTVDHIFRASLRMLSDGGRDLRPQRVERALAAVGLGTDVLRRWPHQLSGGQRQRVMMARALLSEPHLLIADEPTSMLDASLRATILNLLRDVRQEYGMAVLFITHDVGQACYLSDRMLVMRLGKLVESGRTEEVVESPRHEYTRQLLADVPRLARRAG